MKQSDPILPFSQKLISVVIATHNQRESLSKCLRALNRQTIEKDLFEIIVVQDGEDFRTAKWIKKSFPAVRYFSLKENKGSAAARNYGWLIAKGKLIAFTEDDCLPDKKWLLDIYQNYQNESEIAFSGRVQVPLPEFPTDFGLNMAKHAEASFITANCVCSKAALLKVGGFDERFRMAWREDSDLEFKLISENIPIKKLSNALVIHPVKKAAWGISIREQKKSMFNALLFKKFPFLYRQKIGDAPPYYYYVMILLFLGMIFSLFTSALLILIISLMAYTLLFLWFTINRLKKTSRSIDHIAEMLVTSMIIPFVSVYWQWYGFIKYKVLFI